MSFILIFLLVVVGVEATKNRNEKQRQGELSLASGVVHPDNRTGHESVKKPHKQFSVQTGAVTSGVAANNKDAIKAFQQARQDMTLGRRDPDKRSGHVRRGTLPEDDRYASKPVQRFSYDHTAFSLSHALFAFMLAGLVVIFGLRVFNNYQRESDWVATMSSKGGDIVGMDKTKWRTFLKSLGA
eukprot:CAMPEP_0196585086 /NCGR_PEP_ID=MMETSP1081-20130531/49501_1 /TAXON_ID=36882 /ORGANISM="Pyramimonas amylifera, Strain CCMP720" /LENGTH=183 /DNA_ID=CAMNT_0041906517 /DNA_START=104 /DNA_END=655 /DNA_ORIENTATION=-